MNKISNLAQKLRTRGTRLTPFNLDPYKIDTSFNGMSKAWTRDILQEYCKMQGLRYSGTKTDLIHRIREYWGFSRDSTFVKRKVFCNAEQMHLIKNSARRSVQGTLQAANVEWRLCKDEEAGKTEESLELKGEPFNIDKAEMMLQSMLKNTYKQKLQKSDHKELSEAELRMISSVSHCYVNGKTLEVCSAKKADLQCAQDALKYFNYKNPKMILKSSRDDTECNFGLYPTYNDRFPLYFQRVGCYKLCNSVRQGAFNTPSPRNYQYSSGEGGLFDLQKIVDDLTSSIIKSSTKCWPVVSIGDTLVWNSHEHLQNPFLLPAISRSFPERGFFEWLSQSQFKVKLIPADLDHRSVKKIFLNDADVDVETRETFEVSTPQVNAIYLMNNEENKLTLKLMTKNDNDFSDNREVEHLVFNPHYKNDYTISLETSPDSSALIQEISGSSREELLSSLDYRFELQRSDLMTTIRMSDCGEMILHRGRLHLLNHSTDSLKENWMKIISLVEALSNRV